MKHESFFEKVHQVTQRIPPGRVTTYGAIARFLGAPRSARMVGWALNASKHQLHNIPAHRVVNRQGLLTGKNHFGDPNLMARLLVNEGIEINNQQIQNFDTVFWDPQCLLKL